MVLFSPRTVSRQSFFSSLSLTWTGLCNFFLSEKSKVFKGNSTDILEKVPKLEVSVGEVALGKQSKPLPPPFNPPLASSRVLESQ